MGLENTDWANAALVLAFILGALHIYALVRWHRKKKKEASVGVKYDVKVYAMSDGTAQGIPRPLKVLKDSFICKSEESLLSDVIDDIVDYGLIVTLSDGTKVLYPTHVIYKVTYEVSNA